ncbi:MAG: alpha-amylase family glycosyl hydrolase, partial [Chloroflexota bacterium]
MSHDFNLLVAETAHQIVNRQRIPRATYRMQFNKDFTFKDAEALVPYLDALGISDLYTSPILQAVPGSLHGYDICDPRRLNPELGTPDDFARLSDALKARGMGLIMDIVP